jgi:hypothetical protein
MPRFESEKVMNLLSVIGNRPTLPYQLDSLIWEQQRSLFPITEVPCVAPQILRSTIS